MPILPQLGADCALFLDFDGTLTEIAPTPDSVRLADGLLDSLGSLSASLGGALAVVTGRSVDDLDRHLHPLKLPASGVHGVEWRGVDGALHRVGVADLDPARALVDAIQAAAAGGAPLAIWSCWDDPAVGAVSALRRDGRSDVRVYGVGGNPQAIASMQLGETVLDLGSGAGFDCFLAARQVGEAGRVIGVDMTPEMLVKARENARAGGWQNVEFRLGEIEHLPVADQSVDVIISNCVINLSPEKHLVFREAFRVLKPGGRLAVSDMVTSIPLPPELQEDAALYAGCIAGAAPVAELQAMLAEVGFEQIEIKPRDSRQLLESWGAGTTLTDVLFSATIQAVRPR